jgi:hypothetical protein
MYTRYMTLGVGDAVHDRRTLLLSMLPRRNTGRSGNGGIGFAEATLDADESPARLVARTRKSYVVPFHR